MGDPDRGLVGVNNAARHLGDRGITPKTFQPSLESRRDFDAVLKNYRDIIGNDQAMLPDAMVKSTDLYKENVRWVSSLKEEGFTVIDLGNPNSLPSPSVFYEMEKSILFP